MYHHILSLILLINLLLIINQKEVIYFPSIERSLLILIDYTFVLSFHS